MYFKKRELEPEEMSVLENEIFENVSSSYAQLWFELLVQDIRERIKHASEILDVACGPGFLSFELKKKFVNAKIEGIDLSVDAIDRCLSKMDDMADINFKQASVYSLPYKNNVFDLVVCKDSFHHFPEPVPALKEMHRVLKPNGLLYIYDLRRDLPVSILSECISRDTTFKKLQYYSVRASFTQAELENAVKLAGLDNYKIVRRKIEDLDFDYYQSKDFSADNLKKSFDSHNLLLVRK